MAGQPDFEPLKREALATFAASAEEIDPRRMGAGNIRALIADLSLSALHYLDLAESYMKLRDQNRAAQARHRQSLREEAAVRGVPVSVVKKERSRKGDQNGADR